MAVQVSYPGVYIDEFAPGAPIEGVGTSTAAFLGLSKYGPPNQPTRITSWDAFLREFWRPGEKPEDTHYLWYAVRGFFENGGRTCFVVAVSNAQADALVLMDTAATPAPTIVVSARTAGASSGITVRIDPQSAVSAGAFFRASNTASSGSGTLIQFASAAVASQYLAGDVVRIKKGTTEEQAVVARVDGALVRLQSALQNTYSGASINVRLDDFAPGTTTFRATGVEKLAPGSIVEITQTGNPTVIATVVSTTAQRLSAALTTYAVTVDRDISGFDMVGATPIKIVSHDFRLTVRKAGAPDTQYDELAMDAAHPRYFAAVINGDQEGLITAAAVEPPNTTAPPANRPDTGAAFVALAGGADADPSTITSADFDNAVRLLEPIDDVNLVAAPGHDDQAVQMSIVAHCERMQDRFALLATPRATKLFGPGAAESAGERAASSRGYAAVYYPWLLVTSAKSGERVPVPPTGHVAGVFARTDSRRGVFKAPAGVEAAVNGALGVVTPMSDDEQGLLNMRFVNVIRVFQTGGRPVVWGARTTAIDDKNWQYVNVRRLFLFLEESIQEGIRWAVFEPNIPPLWQKLKRSIGAFLTQQWRDGALFGQTAEEAFYVRIDEVLNPDTERALGRLYIEIGVRPAYPAEFIVVRIGIWQGGGDVTES